VRLPVLGRSHDHAARAQKLSIAPTFLRCVGLLIASVLTSTCSSTKQSAAPPAPPSQELLGEMKPVVSVKELMHDMVVPMAENIFNSVKTVSTKNGIVETMPTTDEDWEKIRMSGVGLAEGIYLLKVRRPVVPPGELNYSVGPNTVEFSPAQIRAKIEKDPVEWNARIEALRNVGLEVLDIVRRKDVNELWDAGQNLDTACTNCHRSYWDPTDE